MKIRVIKVGRPAVREYERLVERYETRLSSTYRLDNLVLKSVDHQDLWSRLEPSNPQSRLLVALDERGRRMTSPSLAQFFRETLDDGRIKQLDFVIGGPYGLSDQVRSASQQLWRLSDMVLPSDLAWLILWEQLYRAHAIMTGSKYHHK